jgi:hypothetical protein
VNLAEIARAELAAKRRHTVRPEVDSLLRELVAELAKLFTTPPDRERDRAASD